jgi:putative cell wall-binding protein
MKKFLSLFTSSIIAISSLSTVSAIDKPTSYEIKLPVANLSHASKVLLFLMESIEDDGHSVLETIPAYPDFRFFNEYGEEANYDMNCVYVPYDGERPVDQTQRIEVPFKLKTYNLCRLDGVIISAQAIKSEIYDECPCDIHDGHTSYYEIKLEDEKIEIISRADLEHEAATADEDWRLISRLMNIPA